MDRVVLVGVLFFGVASTTTHDYQYYDRHGQDLYPQLPPIGPTESRCTMQWLEITNFSLEITCENATHIQLHHLQFGVYHAMLSDTLENDKGIIVINTKVSLKLIGTLPIDLNFNENDKTLLEKIKHISFKDNPIRSVPEELNKFTAVEVIEINGYNIDVFNATKFVEFKELNNLNMSYNLIKDIEFNNHTNIPSDFSKLQTIDLSHNLIENMDNFNNLGFTQLTNLDLSYNKIKHFNAVTNTSLKNLQNLYLSHNQILEVGNSLKKLNNIKKLSLDFNQIIAIDAINFAGLDKIEILNLSSNTIQVIDDKAFGCLIELKELDLSNNQVTTIQRQLFKHNIELYSLSLKNNKIEAIEFEAFKDNNFTKFDIDHNSLSGSIDQSFQAAKVENLDLSGMFIGSIKPQTFDKAVRNLNLSHNYIVSIAPLAFSESKSVNILDLSHNWLRKLNFNFSSMPELSFLYLQNNDIQVLFQTTLNNLTCLTELNLSENRPIHLIESKSFKDLQKLEKLLLKNSPQLRGFENGTFDGLSSLSHLDFAYSGITVLQNELFSDLRQLEFLNASHCQISKIELNTFKNLDSIEWIDLSHNSLSEFLVNNNDIFQIRQLDLSFNKIKNISENTFNGLHLLLLLNMANNNLVQIGDSAFTSLKKLEVLNVSSNKGLEIKSNTFSNSSIKSLILRNSSKGLNFEHNINTKITFLDLSSCEIDDINSIYIYYLDIEDLRLNSNQIKKINKHSFSNMTSLKFLDVSSNAISYIQPGTFLHLINLETLNLHDNDIDKLELGAFEGLKNLRTLNLSHNEITNFKILNVRNLPELKTISLDDNKINDLSLFQFLETNISRITIGGNKIPCNQILNARSYYHSYHVVNFTAEVLNYHSENVDGITCTQAVNNMENIDNATYNLANATKKLQAAVIDTISVINGRLGMEMSSIKSTKSGIDSKSNNSNNSRNEYIDIKPMVNITTTCLIFLIVICLTMCVPKIIQVSNIKSLHRYRRQQSGIPLLNTHVEVE